MRTIYTLIIAILFLQLSCQRFYDVTLKNNYSLPIEIELSQYHAANFDGTRPESFTQNLLLRVERVVVPASKSITVTFYDSAGGFWIAWRVISPESFISKSGVLDLTKSEQSIELP
ncbi:MAG: hypothetical protein OEW15_12920 [Nitrospirota bacterium]|nr:hypothetical protein [Nitrospirota bacterium]